MIPLGSCTMKLNATTEMMPVTWPEFGRIHPFAPAEQWGGYRALFDQLEAWLAEITGLRGGVAAAELRRAGRVRRACSRSARYHRGARRGASHGLPDPADRRTARTRRRRCSPACRSSSSRSAADGTIDLADLRAKAEQHAAQLGALMVTYPSTHGVFEDGIREVCEIVHAHGGQVYMDGANMNAQVGLTRPGDIGADVCHLNLHKTFCIPHGGGGPGHGPDRGRRSTSRRTCRGTRSRRTAPAGRAGVGGAVGLGVDPADLVRVHRDDGRARACDARPRSRSSARTTSRTASARTSRCSTRARTAASRTS